VRAPHHSISRPLLHSRASLSTCMSQGFLLPCDLLSGTFHVLFTCASNVIVKLDYKRSVPFTCDSKVNKLDITTFPASSFIELLSERNCSAPHMLLCFSSNSRHFLPSYADFCIVSPCPSPSTGGHCNQLLWGLKYRTRFLGGHCELGEPAHDSDSTPTPTVINSLSYAILITDFIYSLFTVLDPSGAMLAARS
jgi:hypothetical protein